MAAPRALFLLAAAAAAVAVAPLVPAEQTLLFYEETVENQDIGTKVLKEGITYGSRMLKVVREDLLRDGESVQVWIDYGAHSLLQIYHVGRYCLSEPLPESATYPPADWFRNGTYVGMKTDLSGRTLQGWKATNLFNMSTTNWFDVKTDKLVEQQYITIKPFGLLEGTRVYISDTASIPAAGFMKVPACPFNDVRRV
eukprot:TRINITY_DN4487_c0_g1_i1.p1 TRINITY_DN4487_c0_g1~~TRINITY_DN4487_c0_g1_i1.p1  ORF type:complete len:215 (+),score=51.89 TRINITY_DN4487_c0_g1_i1:55-645(+)